MDYLTVEQSLELGDPVELYQFAEGDNVYRYASCAEPVVFEQNTFQSSSIKRDRIKQSQDQNKNTVDIEFPVTDPFGSQFIGFPPSQVVSVTIWRGHFGVNDFVVYWKGRVVGSNADENAVKIQCEPIFTSLRRPGLRARYQLFCRHALYDSGCRVNRNAVAFPGTVSAVNTLDVTVPGLSVNPDGWYTGGMVLYRGVFRFVTLHVGDVITLSQPLSALETGTEITVFPGCDHRKQTCIDKFDNLENFGGFPWIPNKNPFEVNIS
jgi:uncharacterized phage protein (TIGR02218 family)